MSFPSLRTHSYFASPADTRIWGIALGGLLAAGDVIALVGDLGAGKTTLTQAIAYGMRIPEQVTSPTFALAQEYAGRVPLFHFDPYRLDSPEALSEIGFDEYFERGGVIVVEWADKIGTLLPNERLTLTLVQSEAEDDVRIMVSEAVGTRYVALLRTLNVRSDIAPMIRSVE